MSYEENEVYFDPLQVLYDVLNQSIPDINEVRRELSSERERRWIFPTLPEENDNNYPRIALVAGQIQSEEFGGGRIVSEVRQLNNTMTSEVYGTVMTLPITIAAFTRKETEHEVVFADKSTRTLRNRAQAAWLGGRIAKELERNRDKFLEKDIDIFVKRVSGAYEDNNFLWASNVEIELVFKNLWNVDIRNEDVIQEISLSVAVGGD
jgi:hypothetical protein